MLLKLLLRFLPSGGPLGARNGKLAGIYQHCAYTLFSLGVAQRKAYMINLSYDGIIGHLGDSADGFLTYLYTTFYGNSLGIG